MNTSTVKKDGMVTINKDADELNQKMKEQFCTMLLSYFRFFGADVAEMLETFNEVEQRRILHAFMDIIEGDLWRKCDNTVVIDVELDEEIKQPVKLFVNLYCLDQMAEKAIDIAKRTFKKEVYEKED